MARESSKKFRQGPPRFDSETFCEPSIPRLADIKVPEPTVRVGEADVPLRKFIEGVVESTVNQLGIEQPEAVVSELGLRWHNGKIVMHPADPTLQTKDVPLETFFHKIVMVRNQLRVLEQKINAHEKLSDGEKVEMQQYITRCYGSLTTFNVLFKEKEKISSDPNSRRCQRWRMNFSPYCVWRI